MEEKTPFTTGSISKIIIHLPEKLWLGAISRTFPYYEFEIKSFIPISQEPFIGNQLIKIIGSNPQQVLTHIQQHNSLVNAFVVESTPTSITINTQTADNFLLKSLIKNQILVRLPVKITKGDAEFNVTSTRGNIDQFLDDLSHHGILSDIKSLGTYTEDQNQLELTPRQIFVYKKAQELGYYDSPRRISLTELSEQLQIAKSSLSTMLQRIHKKLLGTE